MEEQLARLEQRVVEAIALIQGLREQNAELGERCGGLEAQVDDLTRERDRLQARLGEVEQTAAQAELFEEKRRQIEVRVAGLLDKLEAMG